MTRGTKRRARQAAFSTACFDRSDIRRLNRAASMLKKVSRQTRVLPFDAVAYGHIILDYLIRVHTDRAVLERIVDEGVRIIMEDD
jgi:hypothetical protein